MALRAICAVVALGAAVLGCSSSSSRSASTTSTARATTTQPSSAATSSPTTASAAARCAPAPTASATGGGEVNPPGDIPDNQAFVTYQPPAGHYAVKVPEGWARTATPRSVSFTDKLNTVSVDVAVAAAAPTAATATAHEVPTIAAEAGCFRLVDVTTVRRPAGTAVRVRYKANGPADPVTGRRVLDDVERYEFWRAGTEASLTLSGPAGSDNVDPWRIVTTSFAWR